MNVMSAPECHAPVRILQVVGGLDRGGIETWLHRLMKIVDRDRYRVDFLVNSDRDYPYNADLRALGAKIIPCLGYKNPLKYWRNFKHLYSVHGPYDIVHSQVHYYGGLILPFAKALGCKTRIAHIHPIFDVQRPSVVRSLYRAAMMRSIAANSTHVFACSQATMSALLRECPVKTQKKAVVYNGIDLSEYSEGISRQEVRSMLKLPQDKPLAAYVARFVPHKNQDLVVRLARRLPNVHFVLAGSHGSEMQRIQAESTNLSNLSVFTELADVSQLLRASDLFVFPSLEEGFGVVALEAAAAGLPVVATDLPTIREACAPSHREFMFAPNGEDAALRSIQQIVQDRNLQARLSADAKQWAAQFSIESSWKHLRTLYDEAVRSNVSHMSQCVAN